MDKNMLPKKTFCSFRMCKSITERKIKREQYKNIKTQEMKRKNTNETEEII